MILEIGDYFVVTRGERLHPSILGALAPCGLPAVYSPVWSGLAFEALDVQGPLVAARLVGRTPTAAADFAVGSHHLIDLTRVQVETVGRRFAELLRPVPGTAVSLGLAAVPVPPPERSYVQVGRDQKEAS